MLDAVSLIAEVVSWITLPAGLVLLVVGYIRRALTPHYETAPAVVVGSAESELKARWFGPRGELYELELDRTEHPDITPQSEPVVYFDPARPSYGKLRQPPRQGKHVLQLGWLLVIVGVICVAITFVVLFME